MARGRAALRAAEIYLFECMPRQRNLCVTDTVEWRRETRLAWQGNPLPVVGVFRSSCLSNQFDVRGKRYAGTVNQAGVTHFSSPGEIWASAPDCVPGKPSVRVRYRTP